MPVTTYYYRFSSIATLGGGDLRLSELYTNATDTVAVTSSIAPTTGAPADLDDNNLTTEVIWPVAGGIPTITLQTAGNATEAGQGSGGTVNGQIASCVIEQSTDNATWTLVHSQSLATAATTNTFAANTPFTIEIGESPVDTVSTTEVWEDNILEVTDSASGSDAPVATQNLSLAAVDAAIGAESLVLAYGLQAVDAVDCADTLAHDIFTFYLESIGLSDNLAADANTTGDLTDNAAMLDVIQQAINQIVADSASGTEALSLGAALALVDVAEAVATQTSTYDSVMLVAELIASIDAFNAADGADIVESAALAEAYAARVTALVALLESAQVIDTNTALVHVMQAVSDSADGTADITSSGSLLNALLADAVLATVRLNIGGELFTGWVLNADTLAPSEYQFADLNFNSACKHGDRYLMAADDGIYQFTDEVGVETVMTYIKTGKMDFGSDKHKRVINSYMVYSATGQMQLKVTTSENGQIRTHTYQMAPFASNETTDTRRFDIGKGLKSRYWQFEIVGEDVDCKFDEIGMLPVVLSRRI